MAREKKSLAFGDKLKDKILVAFFIVAFLPGLYLKISGYFLMKSTLQENADSQLLGAADDLMNQLNLWLYERYTDVGTWSTMDVFRTAVEAGGGQAGSNDFLKTLAKQYGAFYYGLMVFDSRGRCISASDSKLIGLNASKQDWFRQMISGRDKAVFDMGTSKETQKVTGKKDSCSMITAARNENPENRTLLVYQVVPDFPLHPSCLQL